MIYRDEEILARVYVTGSDLFNLNDDGTLAESLDIFIENEEDREVVWYEVAEMVHLNVEENGKKLYFMEIPDIDEAKRRIDLYIEQNPTEEK